MMLPRVLCPRATTTMAAWLLLLLSFLSLSVTLASCASSTAPLNSRKAASVVPTAPYHVVNLSRLFWQDAAEESRLLDRVLGTPLAEAFLDLTQAPRVRSLSQAKLAITRQPSYESYSYASPLSSSPPSSLLHQHQQQQQTATPQAMRAQHHGRSNSNSNSNNNVKEEDDGRTAVYTTIYVGGNAAERDEHYCSNYPYHHTHRHTPRHDDATDEKNSAGGQWTAARRYTKLAELAALLAQLPPSAVGKVVRQWRSVDWPVDLPQLHLVYAEDNKSSLLATATTTTRTSTVPARDVRHTASDAADGGSAWAAGEAASGRAHGADEESSSSNYGDEEEERGAKRVHVMNDAKAGRMATLSEVYDALALHTTTTTTTATRMTSTSTKTGDVLLPRTASEVPAWRSSTTLGSAALHSQQQAQAHAHDDTPATAGETDATAAEHHSPHHSYSENNNNDEDGDDNDDAQPAPRSFLYNYYPNEYHEQAAAAAAAVAVEEEHEENIPRMPLTQFRETVVDVDDNRAVVQLNITKFGLTVVRFTGHKGNVINSVAQLRSSRYDRDVPMDNCQGMALAIQLRTKWSPMMSPVRSAAAQNAQRSHAYDVTTAQHPYVKRSMQYKTAAYTNDNNNNNNHHARYGEDDNNNEEEGAWGQLWSSFALLFESSAFCEILPSISMRVSKAPREEYYYLVIQSGPGSGFDRHTVSNCLMEVFIDQTPARRQLTQQLLFALVVPVAVLLLPMPLLLWRADYVQEFMIDMDFTEWIWSPPYVLRDAVLAMALWVFTKVRNAWVARKARRRQMRLEAQHKALLQGFFGGSTANNNTNNNGNARQSGSTTPYLPLPSQGVGREGEANREKEDNNSHHRCREGDEREHGMSYADRTAATATSVVITTAEGDAAMQGHGPRAADAFMEDRTQAQAVRERPLFALPHDINNNSNANTNDANAARSGPPHAALPPAITSDATTIITTRATSTSGDGGHGTGAVEMHNMAHTGSLDERRSEAGMAHDAAAAINSNDDEKKEDAEAQPRTSSSPPAAAAAAAASAAEMTALRMNVEGVMAELHYDGRAKPHDLLFPTTTNNTNTNTITSDTNNDDDNEGTTTVVVAEEAVSDAAGTVVVVSEKADGDKSGAKKTHEEVNEADEEEMNGERLCRICREGEEEEPLVAPCACTGSVRWVHRSCLDHWRLESAKRNLSNVNRCEICKQPFKISIRRTTLLWQGSKHIVRNALLLFACLVCTFGITALVHGVMGGISCTTPYHRASYRNMYNLEGLMLAFIVYAMAMFMFFFAYMIVYSWFRGRREIEEYIAEMHIVPPFMNTRHALCIAVVSVVLFAQVLATGYLLKLFLYATSSIIWNWEASPMVGGMLYGILMTFALAFGGVLRHSIEERREQRRQTRAQDVVIESNNNTTATTTAANDDNNNSSNAAAGTATTAQAGNDAARPATPYPQHEEQEQQPAQAQQRRRRRPRAGQNTVTTAPSSSSSGSSNDESGASHAGSEAGERAEEEEGEHSVSSQARRTSPHANNTNTTTRSNTTTTTSNGNAAAGTAGVVQDYNDIFNVPAELRVIRAVEYCPPRRAMPSP